MKPEAQFATHYPDGKITMIAKVCHEANKAYCESIGDNSQKSWDACPDWQKQSAIAGVKFKLKNMDATPEDMHNSWMKDKQESGWKYGTVKDEVKKEHPCLVSYDKLPPEQRTKDHIFASIVKSLAYFADLF